MLDHERPRTKRRSGKHPAALDGAQPAWEQLDLSEADAPWRSAARAREIANACDQTLQRAPMQARATLMGVLWMIKSAHCPQTPSQAVIAMGLPRPPQQTHESPGGPPEQRAERSTRSQRKPHHHPQQRSRYQAMESQDEKASVTIRQGVSLDAGLTLWPRSSRRPGNQAHRNRLPPLALIPTALAATVLAGMALAATTP